MKKIKLGPTDPDPFKKDPLEEKKLVIIIMNRYKHGSGSDFSKYYRILSLNINSFVTFGYVNVYCYVYKVKVGTGSCREEKSPNPTDPDPLKKKLQIQIRWRKKKLVFI